MNDPFQMKKVSKAAPAVTGSFALRDEAQEEKPRSLKLIRAVKMLDILTSGDGPLREYLAKEQSEAARRVELAKADMELAETPEEAQELRPDPVDELLAQPAPPDLAALKAQLLAQCAKTISEQAATISFKPAKTVELHLPEPPQMFLAPCGLPGCRIHSIHVKTGDIIHHYAEEELTTSVLQEADKALSNPPWPDYIEVYSKHLTVVTAGRRPTHIYL